MPANQGVCKEAKSRFLPSRTRDWTPNYGRRRLCMARHARCGFRQPCEYVWWRWMSRTAVVRTDAASIWATGRTWWQIPQIAKVTFTGTLPQGVTGKDVIVALCGLFSKDEVLNHAI